MSALPTHTTRAGVVVAAVATLLAAPSSAVVDPVPQLHVPACSTGTFGHVSHYYVTTSPGMALPKQHTSADVCWDAQGWQVHMTADDTHVFTPHATCNSQVWENGDVMEVFMAPVVSVQTAPRYYYETDTAPSGALFGAVIDNPKGNATQCNLMHCVKGDLPCSGLSHFPAGVQTVATNTTDGWKVHLTVPWSMFKPAYRPSANGGKPYPLWRGNFYRYDYPNGPSKPFELSGWSPTHNPSFHVPDRFGVLLPQA